MQNGTEAILEEIMAKDFPKIMKDSNHGYKLKESQVEYNTHKHILMPSETYVQTAEKQR